MSVNIIRIASYIKFSSRQYFFLYQGMAFTYGIAYCIDLLLVVKEAEGITLREIQSAFSP